MTTQKTYDTVDDTMYTIKDIIKVYVQATHTAVKQLSGYHAAYPVLEAIIAKQIKKATNKHAMMMTFGILKDDEISGEEIWNDYIKPAMEAADKFVAKKYKIDYEELHNYEA